uniref:Uncharacterized protein n=1 Tax=Arundo donax TaxID=35708 RepID=A0A0A8YTR8_ARUDO
MADARFLLLLVARKTEQQIELLQSNSSHHLFVLLRSNQPRTGRGLPRSSTQGHSELHGELSWRGHGEPSRWSRRAGAMRVRSAVGHHNGPPFCLPGAPTRTCSSQPPLRSSEADCYRAPPRGDLARGGGLRVCDLL